MKRQNYTIRCAISQQLEQFQNRTDHRQRTGFMNEDLEGKGSCLASDMGTEKGAWD